MYKWTEEDETNLWDNMFPKTLRSFVLWILGGALSCLDLTIFKIMGGSLLVISILFFIFRGRIAEPFRSISGRYFKWFEGQRKKCDF